MVKAQEIEAFFAFGQVHDAGLKEVRSIA
jgi:hypothetical protein